VKKNSGFESVSSFKAKLNKLQMGIREYFPIIFDENHFCAVNASIHSFLLGFLREFMKNYKKSS